MRVSILLVSTWTRLLIRQLFLWSGWLVMDTECATRSNAAQVQAHGTLTVLLTGCLWSMNKYALLGQDIKGHNMDIFIIENITYLIIKRYTLPKAT